VRISGLYNHHNGDMPIERVDDFATRFDEGPSPQSPEAVRQLSCGITSTPQYQLPEGSSLSLPGRLSK